MSWAKQIACHGGGTRVSWHQLCKEDFVLLARSVKRDAQSVHRCGLIDARLRVDRLKVAIPLGQRDDVLGERAPVDGLPRGAHRGGTPGEALSPGAIGEIQRAI